MMTKEYTKEELLSAQYDVLGHKPGDFTELRRFAGKGMDTTFCESKEEFVEKALSFITEDIYVGINPRREKTGFATSVASLNCCVIDIDPVRPKGLGSSQEQLDGAITLGTRIRDDFKSGYLVSSGSGCHVYLPIVPIPVHHPEALAQSLKKWTDLIKEKYAPKSQSLYRIDSIFDLPRIIRVWGSFNTKSQRTCTPIGSLDIIPRFAFVFDQSPTKKAVEVSNSDEVTQRLERLCKTNKRLKELCDGGIAFTSKSESDYEFVAILNRAQFSESEITQVWHFNRSGNEAPKKGDIERIVGKTNDTKDSKSFSLANNSTDYFSGLSARKMGIRSGFNSIDEMISGFKEGKIYVIGARPGTGKTSLAMQILVNMAEVGVPGLMFPTEVGREPLMDKIVSRKLQIPLKKFQNGTFNEVDVSKIHGIKSYIESLPLTIYDDFGLNIDDYEREIDKYAPKVVCLDYFQALKWTDPASVGEKEEAVRRIKKLTKDRNIITICLSQLNRSSQGKAQQSELKGTGALEEYADVIGQMYAAETLDLRATDTPINMVITKSKYSATGDIVLGFNRTFANFKEMES